MYSEFVEPTYRGFATVGSYGFVCDQTSLAGVGQVGGNGSEDTRNQLFVWKSKRLPAFWEVWVVNHQ